MLLSPSQENTPTKLGTWQVFFLSQKRWASCKPWHCWQTTQVWDNGYKIEVFNTIDECKVFKSFEEWYNLQRQMGFYSKILQVIWLLKKKWQQKNKIMFNLFEMMRTYSFDHKNMGEKPSQTSHNLYF